MNKFFATVLFALSANAEADPQLLGNTGLGHGLPLSGYPYAGPSYPSLDYAGLAYPALGYGGFGLNPAHPLTTLGAATAATTPIVHLAKREAEADAYYGPYSLAHTGYGAGYGYGLGYGLGSGHGYRLGGIGYPHLGYAGFGLGGSSLVRPAAPAGIVHVAKRAAEADAYYGPYALGYAGYGTGFGYMGLGHPARFGYPGHGLVMGYPALGTNSLAYTGLGYTPAPAPVSDVTPLVDAPSVVSDESPAENATPVDEASPLGDAILDNSRLASTSPYVSLTVTGNAPAAIPAVGGAYAGAGRYIANSAGVVHVAKREADAQYSAYGLGYSGFPAGAGYGYGGLAHPGYGYAAPGYPRYGYPGLGFSGLGYTRHGYTGLGYAAPVDIAASAEGSGQSSKSASSSQTILGDAPAAVPAVRGGYAAAGRYVANSAGVVHAA